MPESFSIILVNELLFWIPAFSKIAIWFFCCLLPFIIYIAARKRKELISKKEKQVAFSFSLLFISGGFTFLLEVISLWVPQVAPIRLFFVTLCSIISALNVWLLYSLTSFISTVQTGESVAKLVEATGHPIASELNIDETIASVLHSTSEHRRAKRLARRVYESPIGICEVNSSGTILEIDGGALDRAGAIRENWLGLQLSTPHYLAAIDDAMKGKRTTFAEMDPAKGICPTMVNYSPRLSHSGEYEGATVTWLIGEPYTTFEVKDG